MGGAIHVALVSAAPTQAEARALFDFDAGPYRGLWFLPTPERPVVHVFSAVTEAELTGQGWAYLDIAQRRHHVRLAQQTAAAAARCGVPLTEWQAMTRAERKAAKHAARPRPEGARRD